MILTKQLWRIPFVQVPFEEKRSAFSGNDDVQGINELTEPCRGGSTYPEHREPHTGRFANIQDFGKTNDKHM